MDYGKQFRSFINSYYAGEGVRITIGILLPSIFAGYLHALPIGINISLGALGIAISDNPGPILHRKNGFIAGSIILFLVSLIIGFTGQIAWLYGIILPILCFIFSMFAVFGTRAASIGIAALLVLVLQADHKYQNWQEIFKVSLYITAGAVWYSLLSLALYQLRPYKIVQQALGEYVEAISRYLRQKGNLFQKNADVEATYAQLLKLQTDVLEKQQLTAELIFKTRNFVKESTPISRMLMLTFLDATDLLEVSMTSHQDYTALHAFTPAEKLLQSYSEIIYDLANYLEEAGIVLKSGTSIQFHTDFNQSMQGLRNDYQQLHTAYISSNNIALLISLKHILDSIEAIAGRIKTLERYISYRKNIPENIHKATNPEDFISHQRISVGILLDNLSIHSNIFRHSIRIALAALTAYFTAQFLLLGHSYWLLLTVIVILKPAYNLTKKRNKERLIGTVFGAALGASILYFIQNDAILLIILTISMLVAYSFMRTQYVISVIAITLYVLLLYHLLNFHNYRLLITDRLIDTAIGSAIAITFSYLLPPIWEKTQFNALLEKAISDSKEYFNSLHAVFTGKTLYQKASMRLLRKKSWVAIANVSDSFNRMLSEPKNQQKQLTQIHQIVVLLHLLSARLATLNYFAEQLHPLYITPELDELGALIEAYFMHTIYQLQTNILVEPKTLNQVNNQSAIDEKINHLLEVRNHEINTGQINSTTRPYLSTLKSITDQYYFIFNTAYDIAKISTQMFLSKQKLTLQS